MSIMMLPVLRYPFINTQNQFLNYNGDEKKFEIPDFIEFMRMHNLQHPQSQITSEEEYFMDSWNKELKSNLNLGELYFEINLSEDCYNAGFFKNKPDMDNIVFIIFYDDEKRKKWYYFVEDKKRISEKLYTFSLSLDVIKTYWDYIYSLDNMASVRYFPKVDDYFSFNNNSGFNRFDVVLPEYTNPVIKLPMGNYIKLKGQDEGYILGGLWSYFYMSYSSEDGFMKTLSFNKEDYYIIAMPKYPALYSDMNKSMYEYLMSCPYLLKVVDSTVNPFCNNLLFNNVIDFDINYITGSTLDEYEQEITINTHNNNSTWFYKKDNNYYPYLFCACTTEEIEDDKTCWKFYDAPLSLQNYLQDVKFDYFMERAKLLFIYKNNPANKEDNYENCLFPVDVYDPFKKYEMFEDLEENIFKIKFDKNKMKSSGWVDNNTGLYVFLNYEIGYLENVKMPIIFDYLQKWRNNNIIMLPFLFNEKIYHNVAQSIELINYNDIDDIEISTKRSIELKQTKITDDYINYLFLNENAIKQKEYQMNKWVDAKAVANFAVGTTISALSGNPLGVLSGTYNLINNVAENEKNRKMYQAEQKDKMKSPKQYENGNYNMSYSYRDFMPHIIVYGDKSIYKNNILLDDIGDFNDIVKSDELCHAINYYSLYSPEVGKSMKSMLNRRHVNFIQIDQLDNAMNRYNMTINNNHLKLILDILKNGIRFMSIYYYEDEGEGNDEI